MKAYKMEVRFTILLTALFLLAGNVALVFSIFPVQGNLFGFPIMYIVPILSGWFGILFLTIVANKAGNKIDEEIERENGLLTSTSAETETGKQKKSHNKEGA
ncbi:hypothetical protein [Salipaludibacillus aurantiacus]|uniref:Solute:sodium symporter small subunit n=1 Tax=Salipaludibacillus aurantiacus TaxID=1601833 RepID=A0A1H9VK98_9BACI|nr:hypothetical protein [Salipaludibacillus aurantiacus]SES21931.1 hypothetical protein SAMN05518684_11138 [Salipaludibacillus aurantiacus]